jgi:hypothetical protein
VLGTLPQCWERIQIITAGAMGLLRRYEEARATG